MNTLAEGMSDMGGMGMIWMLIWGLVGLALLALAAVGLVWLVRRGGPGDQGAGRPETPEDILRRRYAAGELDEDEYLRRRAGIQED